MKWAGLFRAVKIATDTQPARKTIVTSARLTPLSQDSRDRSGTSASQMAIETGILQAVCRVRTNTVHHARCRVSSDVLAEEGADSVREDWG